MTSGTLQKLCDLIAGKRSPQAVEPEEWPALVAIAADHNLSPLLMWLVAKNETSIPDDLGEQLRTAQRHAAIRFMLLHKAQETISQTLNRASIPHIWLKGIALAATIYPDPAQRPMGDLDVLVAHDQLLAALDSLLKNGYHYAEYPALFDTNALVAQARSHHYVLRGGPADSVMLELHYRMINARSWPLFPLEQERWFHQQTTRYALGSRWFTTLSSEAHLLYLCAHMVLHHGLEDFVLTRFLDLHYMITTRPLDWGIVVNKAVELRWTYATEQALRQTQAFFATPVPQMVLDDLRRQRPADENVRRARALSQPGASFERVRWSLQRLTWNERGAWVWAIAVPRQDYMRWRYDIPADRPLWPYYIRRWQQQLRYMMDWISLQLRLVKKGHDSQAEK